MVGSGPRVEDLHTAALEQGMIDLKRYAAILLTEDFTTIEKVMSVVSVET